MPHSCLAVLWCAQRGRHLTRTGAHREKGTTNIERRRTARCVSSATTDRPRPVCLLCALRAPDYQRGPVSLSKRRTTKWAAITAPSPFSLPSARAHRRHGFLFCPQSTHPRLGGRPPPQLPAVSQQTRAKRPFSERPTPLPTTASTSRTSDKEKPARAETGHFQISLCACVCLVRASSSGASAALGARTPPGGGTHTALPSSHRLAR